MNQAPQLKIFSGYRLTPEVKIALTSIMDSGKLEPLSFVIIEGKEYLGLYLDNSPSTLNDVKKNQEKIHKHLLSCLPELPLSPHTFVVFPQAFLI
ncbi:MAG: hypothetical protein KDK55_00885 [Chlamydiia bacterium]|nr:hypothetical protein [Chlamydiia bacterium]